MKCISIAVLLLALGLPVLAADSFPINVYPCPKTDAAPVLDGKLDDAVWQQAPVVSGFTVFQTHQPDLHYHLAFNPAGSLYDGEREATVWSSNAQVVTCLGGDFWSAELAVP